MSLILVQLFSLVKGGRQNVWLDWKILVKTYQILLKEQPPSSKCYSFKNFKNSNFIMDTKVDGGWTLCSKTNIFSFEHNPDSIYLLKVNNRNIRKRCDICSKLTIKTPERRLWRRSGVFIVNFEHISHLFYYFYCWLWKSKY